MFSDTVDGVVALTGDNSNLFWDVDNLRLGIGTDDPQQALHVEGNIWANGGEIYFGSEKTSIGFYDSVWGASTGYVIGPDSTTDTPEENP